MALINTTTTGVLGSTFYGDGTGDLTIQQNGVTINKITSQQGFSAYLSANQSITQGQFTKAQFNTTEFNLGNVYDATTNYRFTPTVAGYYQVNLKMYTSGTSSTSANAYIYKNGASFKAGQIITANQQVVSVPAIIHLNGSTDYIEAFAYVAGGTGIVIAGTTSNSPFCYFQAMLIRSA
jgi:hypothetical protein